MSGDNPQNEFPPNSGQVPPPKGAGPPPPPGAQQYYGPQGGPNPYAEQAGPMPGHAPMAISSEDRNMAMLAHLLGALLGFLGPLIIWLVKKDDSPFVNDQGKEALNFQLTLLIFYFIAVFVTVISCGIIFFAPMVPWLLQLIFGIIGAVAANKGEYYRYPMTIRMIS